MLCGMWDLSSPVRDQTCVPCLGNAILTTGLLGKSLNQMIILCLALYLFRFLRNCPTVSTVLNHFIVLLAVYVKVAQLCPTHCDHMESIAIPYSSWTSLGQNTGMGSHSLLQGIFPTQGLNPGLPCYRWILYQLSHQVSLVVYEGSNFSTSSPTLTFCCLLFFFNYSSPIGNGTSLWI